MTHINDFIIDEFDEISSTQNYAKELIANGQAKHSKVISARKQSNARGRYERKWVTSKDNIAITIILKATDDDQQVCYLAGLAVLATLTKYAPHDDIKLKWVNDVLINRKKICGILLEKVGDFLLVGIGLNLQYEESFTPLEATGLDQLCTDFSRTEVIEEILNAFKSQYNSWLDYGFSPVRRQWLEHAYKINKDVKVNLPNSNFIVGNLLDIDNEGYLVLGTASGERRIAVGELFDL